MRNMQAPQLRSAPNVFIGWCAFAAITISSATAAPPIDPLPAPLYSFDLPSPAVVNGLVEARDVLVFNPPFPQVAVPGVDLELFFPEDDIDALSDPTPIIDQTTPFVVLFSVDRNTRGLAPIDPQLFHLEVPYNVTDQAARGHASGDQYVALTIFNAPTPFRSARNLSNNSLVRNNFDEGGSSFGATPSTSSRDTSTGDEDNTNATGGYSSSTRDVRNDIINNVYFTLTPDSPSNDILPGSQFPSPANIFYAPGPFRQTTTLYASALDLGLQPADDIDGMVVLDRGVLGTWDIGDRVIFTLAPGSPSLGMISGGSMTAPAADFYSIRYGMMTPNTLLRADEFGLGHPFDNVDGLTILPILEDDIIDFVTLHGIRAVLGDVDDDGDVDADDFDVWNFLLTGPDNGPIPLGVFVVDTNLDGDLDLADLAELQTRFTGSF
jgi:hypothetical protein